MARLYKRDVAVYPAVTESAAAGEAIAMQISDLGIDFIKQWEGCSLTAYQDVAGVWTIGVGHTGGVEPGDSITEEEAEALLLEDLAWVEECIHDTVNVPLHQPHYDALCSFIFNIGGSAFAGSTMLELLNEYLYWDASLQFDRWVNAGGEQVQGLVNRRNAEQLIFQGEVP